MPIIMPVTIRQDNNDNKTITQTNDKKMTKTKITKTDKKWQTENDKTMTKN